MKLWRLPDSSWTQFTGITNSADLVAGAVGIHDHSHIYPFQPGFEIAPAFGGTQNKNKNRRKKKKVFMHLS